MAICKDIQDDENIKEEMQWARFRSIWHPLMNMAYKKEGGGKYEPTDLIKLRFDVVEEIKPISFKEAKALLGSRIKKEDGK